MNRLLLAAAALCAAACTPDCPEPSYGGLAVDEAWMSFVDGQSRATAEPMKAAAVSIPNEGQGFPAGGDAPTFSWTTPLSASLAPRVSPKKRFSVSELFISSAYAHGTPVTGPTHWARIFVPGRACLVEEVTTLTTWKLKASQWDVLKEAKGQPLTLQIFSAYLTENRITEGPFKLSKPVGFTVTP